MNPIRDAAADAATYGWLLGLMTALFTVGFGGWVVWACLPGNRSRFDDAARLPFDDGDPR